MSTVVEHAPFVVAEEVFRGSNMILYSFARTHGLMGFVCRCSKGRLCRSREQESRGDCHIDGHIHVSASAQQAMTLRMCFALKFFAKVAVFGQCVY